MVRIAFLETSVCSLFLSSCLKKHTTQLNQLFQEKIHKGPNLQDSSERGVFLTLKALVSFER